MVSSTILEDTAVCVVQVEIAGQLGGGGLSSVSAVALLLFTRQKVYRQGVPGSQVGLDIPGIIVFIE